MELRRKKDKIRNKILPENILQWCQNYFMLNSSKYVKATLARVCHKHDYYVALILQNKCTENTFWEYNYKLTQ